MDTFEIDVQFYPQIEKFMEQLHSGTEREKNIFLFGTRYFQNEQFYIEKRRHKHCNHDGIGNLHLQGKRIFVEIRFRRLHSFF